MLFKVIVNEKPNEIHATVTSLHEWHKRLGHVSKQTLQKTIDSQAVTGVNPADKNTFFCETCQFGKAHRLKFNKTHTDQNWKPGEYIHSDVCGPFSETSIGGSRYYVSFINDASNYRTIYFIKHKADVLNKFKEFERMIHNKFDRNIKILRADNGREYSNTAFHEYLKSYGIILESTAPYTTTKWQGETRK